MGSIAYVKSKQKLFNHLSTTAGQVNKGGLYLIENIRLDWGKELFKKGTWTKKRGSITTKTSYQLNMHDALKHELLEDFRCEVKDGRKKHVLHNKTITPMIFPKEYLEIAQKTKKWEVIGFFEYQSMKPLKKATPFNYLLLRRI